MSLLARQRGILVAGKLFISLGDNNAAIRARKMFALFDQEQSSRESKLQTHHVLHAIEVIVGFSIHEREYDAWALQEWTLVLRCAIH